jgi:hypothetical protein
VWNALSISDNLYGFQSEQSYRATWVATATLQDSDEQLKIEAEIFLISMKSGDEYMLLLEAIRQFSKYKMSELGKSSYTIHFQCKGLLDRSSDIPLLVTRVFNGSLFVDVEFSEHFEIKPIVDHS